MSNRHRIGILVATAVALVVAFVVLAPDDDEDEISSSTTPTAVAPAEPGTTTEAPATTTTAPEPQPEPEPEFTTVRVRGGEAAEGIETIEVTRGERVRVQFTTPDTSDEIHVHGYDLTEDLAPGRRARFSFEADAEGIFEIELHGSGAQIAELEVRPG